LEEGSVAVNGNVHRVRLFTEAFGQHTSCSGFVLNQQNPHVKTLFGSDHSDGNMNAP
jgi:hypothetical protein